MVNKCDYYIRRIYCNSCQYVSIYVNEHEAYEFETFVKEGVAMVKPVAWLATDQQVELSSLWHVSSKILLISPGVPRSYKTFTVP